MEKLFNKLLKNEFMLVVELNFLEEDVLESHAKGFKRHISLDENYVTAYPQQGVATGKTFMKTIRNFYNYNHFKSASIAVIDKNLICQLLGLTDLEYQQLISTEGKSLCVEEEFGWFTYSSINEGLSFYYRIPKELIIGSLIYNPKAENATFVSNDNYYHNMQPQEQINFIKKYLALLRNEIINCDSRKKYSYDNVDQLYEMANKNNQLIEEEPMVLKLQK